MRNSDETSVHLVTNSVANDLNVLGVLIDNGIFGKEDSTRLPHNIIMPPYIIKPTSWITNEPIASQRRYVPYPSTLLLH